MASTAHRRTRETDISVSIDTGGGPVEIRTGAGFLDHLLVAMAHHGQLGLRVSASGDLETGSHHLSEDVGITLGQALASAWGDRQHVERFGHAVVPMDDALVMVALDVGGRPHLSLELGVAHRVWENWDTDSWPAFLGGLIAGGGITLHMRRLAGEDAHHLLEAGAKALGIALGLASAPAARGSTKGPIGSEPACS